MFNPQIYKQEITKNREMHDVYTVEGGPKTELKSAEEDEEDLGVSLGPKRSLVKDEEEEPPPTCLFAFSIIYTKKNKWSISAFLICQVSCVDQRTKLP